MRAKTRKIFDGNVLDFGKKLSVPGPGAYKTLDTLTTTGKYFYSRFKDSGNNALRSTAYRWGQENKTLKIVPGPGRYEHPVTITNVGKNFLSKFKSSGCRKFSLAKRNDVLGAKKSNRSF